MALEINQDLIREFFTYFEDSGKFVSKGRSRKYFKCDGTHKAFNTRYKGKDSGCYDKDGYKVVNIMGKDYRVHRLIFLYMTGSIPSEDVDHQNGIRDDNRWINIRAVSRRENTRNACKREDNTSGVTGVTFEKGLSKWRSRINDKLGGKVHIGVFSDWFDAVCSRKSAEIKYGYHANHGRDPIGGVSSLLIPE